LRHGCACSSGSPARSSGVEREFTEVPVFVVESNDTFCDLVESKLPGSDREIEVVGKRRNCENCERQASNKGEEVNHSR
jgi:hypothetical protein